MHPSTHSVSRASYQPLPLTLTKLTNNSPALLKIFTVKDPVLVSCRIGHALIFLVLLRVDIVQERLAMRRLLVKLDEVAASTTVGLCHILKASPF